MAEHELLIHFRQYLEELDNVKPTNFSNMFPLANISALDLLNKYEYLRLNDVYIN